MFTTQSSLLGGVAVTPWLRVTTDLQWIDPANGASEAMGVAGLRAKLLF